MATTTEKIKISLQADVTQTISQLNKVKSELKAIAQDSSIKVDSVGLNKTISYLDQYKKALKYNIKMMTVNDFKNYIGLETKSF